MSCGIDKDTVSSFAKRILDRDNDEVVFELNLFLKKSRFDVPSCTAK